MTVERLALGLSLVLLGCGDPVQNLIDDVIERGDAREQAMLNLRMWDGDVVPTVLTVLQDGRRPMQGRLDLLDVLRGIYLAKTDRRISEGVMSLIHDLDPVLRRAVYRTLSDIGKVDDLPALIDRLDAEEEEEAILDLLDALTSLGGWHISYNSHYQWVYGGEDLAPEERDQLADRIQDLFATAQTDTLRDEAEEFLERLAVQKMQGAHGLVLAAKTEWRFESPTSMNRR